MANPTDQHQVAMTQAGPTHKKSNSLMNSKMA